MDHCALFTISGFSIFIALFYNYIVKTYNFCKKNWIIKIISSIIANKIEVI